MCGLDLGHQCAVGLAGAGTPDGEAIGLCQKTYSLPLCCISSKQVDCAPMPNLVAADWNEDLMIVETGNPGKTRLTSPSIEVMMPCTSTKKTMSRQQGSMWWLIASKQGRPSCPAQISHHLLCCGTWWAIATTWLSCSSSERQGYTKSCSAAYTGRTPLDRKAMLYNSLSCICFVSPLT